MNERQLLRVRRKFGMVFQGSAPCSNNGCRKCEHSGCAGMTTDPDGNRPAHRETLELCQETKNPAELSAACASRAGARDCMNRKSWNKPTTGLDPIVSDSMACATGWRTTVVVTHRTARRVGQRVLIHENKRIYARGAPENFLCARPRCRSQGNSVLVMDKSHCWKRSRPVRVRRTGAAGRVADPVEQGHQRGTYELRLHALNVGGLEHNTQRAPLRRAGRRRLVIRLHQTARA